VGLPGDSYWVEKSELLAGPYPGDPDAEAERRKLGAFLDLGIGRFIDLTESGEHSPYAPMLEWLAAERDVDVDHTRMAIPDFGVPAPSRMRAILDLLDADLERGTPVYLHCRGGAGRTGTVVGCYLVERGEPPERALADIAADRRDLHSKRSSWSSPETEEQRRFVLEWRPGRG
jgi:protein-tyrosine phosphatase